MSSWERVGGEEAPSGAGPGPPAGWYPDPAVAGGARWWDGAAWTGHAAPGPGAFAMRTPLRLDEERAMGERARLALWFGAAAYSISIVSQGIYLSLFFSSMSDTLSRPSRAGDPFAGMHPGVLAFAGLGQLASIAQIVVGILFVLWFHRSLENARALGLPLRRDPIWGILGFLIPIINLWFPYQSMCDLFPPDHPARRLAGRWWALYIGAGLAAVLVFVGGIVSVYLGVAFGLVVGAMYVAAAMAARELIVQASEVHEALAGPAPAQAGPAGSGPAGSGPAGWGVAP